MSHGVPAQVRRLPQLYHDADGHRCSGLRSVDWARFMHSLREWMASDPHAQFEILYARRREAGRDL
jgi:hypothetical protein